MKKLIIIAVVALFTLTISAAEKPVKPSETLRSEIVKLLANDLSFEMEKNELIVAIVFTVTNKGVVILSTDAPNKSVEDPLKSKLYYKVVDFKTTKTREIFLLPLRIKNS